MHTHISQTGNVACLGGNVVTAISLFLYIYIVLSTYIYVNMYISMHAHAHFISLLEMQTRACPYMEFESRMRDQAERERSPAQWGGP